VTDRTNLKHHYNIHIDNGTGLHATRLYDYCTRYDYIIRILQINIIIFPNIFAGDDEIINGL